MSKKAYLLLSSVATLSLIGVSLAQVPSRKLEATETSYARSVTLTGALLQKTLNHDPYALVVGGISISIGTGVYGDSNGRIVIDGTYDSGTAIIFPKVVTQSGAHGTGYASVTWSKPSVAGTYCNDVGVRCYTSADYYQNVASTLNSTAPVTTAIPSDHSATIKLYSAHTDSYFTLLSQVVVTYNCSLS